MSVEDTINIHHEAVIVSFVDDLLLPLIKPGEDTGGVFYFKDTAAQALTERLQKDGVRLQVTPDDFEKALYGAFNKKPLKQFGYGMLNAQIPRQVAEQLMPWEALYAYAGIWSRKSDSHHAMRFSRRVLGTQTLYEVVYDIVVTGMQRIKIVHNREHDKGEYAARMESAPHEDEIRQRLCVPKIQGPKALREYNPSQTRLF